MVSRPLTRAQLIDQIENVLDDSSNAIWSAARLGLLLDDAITEVSEYSPYIMRDIYTIESRFGTASATSANNLVDTDKSPFSSSDTGKVVYNTTDKTWAVIESFSSSSQVGISKDIFTEGEGYEIYNKGCFNKRQINIENSDDFLWIVGAVYPVRPDLSQVPFQNMRNVILYERNKIAEIDVAWVDNSGKSDADVDVYIYFARQHKLNPMTDLSGAVNNASGYSAGDTSMALDGLQASGTIFKDTLFTVALASGIDSRLTYRVTADATISSNAATISFWPALEADVADDAVVTFVGSTLTPELERIIVQIVAGEALMSEGLAQINEIAKGGTTVSNKYYQMGERMAEKARAKLKGLIDVDLRATKIHSRA